MTLLLHDLAEETKASNQRLADRLDEEARDLRRLERECEELRQNVTESGAEVDEVRHATAALKQLQQRGVESARQATDYAITLRPRSEVIWLGSIAQLRKNPNQEEAVRLLQGLLNVLLSGEQVVQSARSLWRVPQELGTVPERLEELDQAAEWFQKRAAEARLALEHRSSSWQPADPDRLKLGLQLAREGKAIAADEARARFRRSPG
jgi:predicted RNase H-like nuclease (RuvC/YqgF family)